MLNKKPFWLTGLLLMLCVDAQAGSYYLLNPHEFERQTGKPVWEEVEFTAKDTESGYTIKVYNGGQADAGGTGYKVRSGEIRLNGERIFGPDDFQESKIVGLLYDLVNFILRLVGQAEIDEPDYFSETVTVQPNNILSVKLNGKPGGLITVVVEGEDAIPPAITASIDSPPNAAGWHRTDVTVSFECEDGASGLVACPEPVTVSSEGANQQITGTVEDMAGNRAQATVTLNIDKTAPAITPRPEPASNTAGWHNVPVTVHFDCADALSGVADCSGPVSVVTEGGERSISGSVTDLAGNTAVAELSVRLDRTPPAITAGIDPLPNAAGWHRTDVAVSFHCEDTLSGIVLCPEQVVIGSEGANQPVSGAVQDVAGNPAQVSVMLNIDKTAPSIAPRSEPPPNAAGWHNTPMMVYFDCADGLSGVAGCTEPVAVTAEGAARIVGGSVTDTAGNTAGAELIVNLDRTPPTLHTQFSAEPGAAGWFNQPVTLEFICEDALSGVHSCPPAQTIGEEGRDQVVTVSATDNADNSRTETQTVHLDVTPPTIDITEPAEGAAFLNTRPPITLTFADNFTPDTASLVLSFNDQPLEADCDIGEGVASCTPVNELPRETITLRAGIEDLADNPATSTVQFRIQTDGDGDNVADEDDVFPADPNEWADLDGDKTGDNSDPDRDGDGIGNEYEIQAGTDPNDPASVPPDLDGDGIPDDLDTDRDGDGYSNDDEQQFGHNPDDPADNPSIVPPVVSVNDVETETSFPDIELSGAAAGAYHPVVRVYLTSDRLPGIEFEAGYQDGNWQATVPLEPGDNAITVTAENDIGKTATTSVTIERMVAVIFDLTIDAPQDQAVFNKDSITVTGRVISEAPVATPAVTVNGVAATVQQGASPVEFTYHAAGIGLSEGDNVIMAQTTIAERNLQQSIVVAYVPEQQQVPPPLINIRSPVPGATLNSDSFILTADIQSDVGLQAVTLNGEPVSLLNGALLQETVTFAGDAPSIELSIAATDTLDQTTTRTVTYRRDTQPPSIEVEGLSAFPAENTVTENPYTLRGTVTDSGLSQLTVNGRPLSLEPTAEAGRYRFAAGLQLSAGPAQNIAIAAVDAAGNRSQREYLLALSSNVQVEWLLPEEGARILLGEAGQAVNVSARVANAVGGEQYRVYLQTAPDQSVKLVYEQGLVNGQLPLPAVAGEYTLQLDVLDAANNLLTGASRRVELKAAEEVPLQIVKVTPADEAADVEPNAFIGIFFNKPVELAKLAVTLNETVHGFSYVNADPQGIDGLRAQGYVLQEVNRDYEPVPGVLSLLDTGTVATLYPERDMAYGADLYLNIAYDGEELLRRHFQIRPRPTFIEGGVLDNLAQPVAGITVQIPELKRTATTDIDGVFTFGYGERADQTIPSGRYRLLVNPGLKDPRFASYRGWINIQAGNRNVLDTTRLPLLNPNIAFSVVRGGQATVANGGELTLDFTATDARPLFSDGGDEGRIHVQFLPLSSINVRSFDPRYTPLWAYATQPVDVGVEGRLAVDFELPAFQGSYDYAPVENEPVVLLGLDPQRMVLRPVGVGRATAAHRIHSAGETHFQVLDFIAYARVFPELRATLNDYTDGKISLDALRVALQTYEFTPPDVSELQE